MKKLITIFTLILLSSLSAFADGGNPFDVSFPVFSDADVFIKSQKIVCTEKLVSIDYVISGKEKENVSAVIDCKVLGFQRLCNDIVIPLDFCIKSDGKEIPFEVYRNGNLVDKSSYYSGLKEYGGEYKYEDKIEIKFDFELKNEKTITVSYENLESYHMFGSLYIIQMAKNPDGTPIDYTFIYQGLADSKLYPSKMCLSINDGRGYTKQDYTLQFSRDTKGEFFWKTELNQFSALDGECFWIEFKYFGVLEEFELVFIPCWDENPMIIAYTDESSCINLSKEIIPEALLFYMTKSQLALLRNAFYAIHGYKFKNPKYAEYFGHESNELWYKINPNFTEKDFNEIEKANINLIKKYEER